MNTVKRRLPQQIGFTLTELLIVVSIVGILVSIAYPAYQSHATRTRFADAQVKLLEVMQEQRKFFTSNNTYTTNLVTDLGYQDAGGGAVESDNSFYLITAEICGEGEVITECVLLTAAPNFTGGNQTSLTYNSRNEKSGPAAAW